MRIIIPNLAERWQRRGGGAVGRRLMMVVVVVVVRRGCAADRVPWDLD